MSTDLTYDNESASGGQSLKWSAVGLIGRQGLVALFALILARILGPDSYGVVAQASIYISLTTLLLDQGVAAALMRAGSVSRDTVGAAITLNVGLSLLLGGITVVVAPLIAIFFRSPELTEIIMVLGGGLLLKGLAIIPRMLLGRKLDFQSVAIADLLAAITGGVLGLILAAGGAGYWSLIVQTLAMDLVAAVILIAVAKPPRPNLKLRTIRPMLGFSARVFASNLFSYAAGNADSVLIGRYLGAASLASYDIAYRFLRMPVTITGQILNRVLFPLVAGKVHRGEPVAPAIVRSLGGIAFLTFPLMALVGVSAPELVPVVLGEQWTDVVPILIVFAVSGARQSLTTINTPVLLGLGQAKAQLRFSAVAATTQVLAIVIGLQWGALGVAIGYTVAGIALTPMIAAMQKRYAGVSYRQQVVAIWPATHASLWAIAVYYVVGRVTALSDGLQLFVGGTTGALVYVLVLTIVHRGFSRVVMQEFRTVLARRAR
jgi:PST family polysaccharide transporter